MARSSGSAACSAEGEFAPESPHFAMAHKALSFSAGRIRSFRRGRHHLWTHGRTRKESPVETMGPLFPHVREALGADRHQRVVFQRTGAIEPGLRNRDRECGASSSNC